MPSLSPSPFQRLFPFSRLSHKRRLAPMHPGAQVHRVVVLPRPREKRRDTGVVSRLMAISCIYCIYCFPFFFLAGLALRLRMRANSPGLSNICLAALRYSPSQRLFPSSRLSHKRRLCRRPRCPGSPCRGFATTPRKKARQGCCVAPDGNSLVFIVSIVFLFSSWRVWP